MKRKRKSEIKRMRQVSRPFIQKSNLTLSILLQLNMERASYEREQEGEVNKISSHLKTQNRLMGALKGTLQNNWN